MPRYADPAVRPGTARESRRSGADRAGRRHARPPAHRQERGSPSTIPRPALVLGCLCAATLALLASCSSTPPGKPYSADGFLLRSALPPEEARRLASDAGGFLESLGSYLGLEPPPGGLLRIYHFRHRLNLWRYMGQAEPSLRWRRGACVETPETYLILVSGGGDSTGLRETLQHELTHYLLTVHFSHVPPWIDEGLAQVASQGPPFPHLAPGGKRAAQQTLRTHSVRTCRHLLQRPPGARLRRHEYLLASGVTYHLLRSIPDATDRLRAYLASVGPEAVPEQVFLSAWGLSPEEACEAGRAWAASGR